MVGPTPTPTSTPEPWNATGGAITTGFASSSGLVPMAVLVFAILVAFIGAFVMSSYHRFALFRRAVGWIGTSGVYFLQGLGALAALALISAPVYLFADASPDTQGVVLKWAGIALAGYVVVVAIGYVADELYQRARAYNTRLRAGGEPAADGGDGDDVTL